MTARMRMAVLGLTLALGPLTGCRHAPQHHYTSRYEYGTPYQAAYSQRQPMSAQVVVPVSAPVGMAAPVPEANPGLSGSVTMMRPVPVATLEAPVPATPGELQQAAGALPAAGAVQWAHNPRPTPA